MRATFSLFGESFRRWMLADSDQLAAAIAFHAVLSIAPLLLLILVATSQMFGGSAPDVLRDALTSLLGARAVEQSQALVDMILAARGGRAATVTSLVMFVVFGSAVFRQLRHALARTWGAPSKSLRWILFERIVSYGLVPVVVVAVLLLIGISLMISLAGLVVVMHLPRGAQLWGSLHALLSLGLLTVLIAVVFRYGPGVSVRWTDVWGGAALTAVMVSVGNAVIGVGVARSVLVPLYGPAGAVVVVLLWSYYSAHILLFGSHFTRVYAERFGSWQDRAHTGLPDPGIEARPLPRVETRTPFPT